MVAASKLKPMSAGFPNASGTCSSANGADVNRIPVGVVIAADVVFFVADGVREFAQDACKQEAVVLGEGGNTSLACIIVDTVWIVAKAVDEGIHFCDDDLTGNIIDANYARLDHIHTDLAAVQGTPIQSTLTSRQQYADFRRITPLYASYECGYAHRQRIRDFDWSGYDPCRQFVGPTHRSPKQAGGRSEANHEVGTDTRRTEANCSGDFNLQRCIDRCNGLPGRPADVRSG